MRNAQSLSTPALNRFQELNCKEIVQTEGGVMGRITDDGQLIGCTEPPFKILGTDRNNPDGLIYGR